MDITTKVAADALQLSPEQAAAILTRLQETGIRIVPRVVDRNAPTPQQARIGVLVAEGWTNKEIGRQLGLTEETVKAHLKQLLTKTQFTNRTQYAVWAKTGVRPASAPPIASVEG
jgi:DNA-binding NarL/FixJ family response regulator